MLSLLLLLQSTTVVRLGNMLTREELTDAEEYEDILLEIVNEVEKYGNLQKAVVPRPAEDADKDPKGVRRAVYSGF